jgi:hypothetical protein
MRICKPKSKQHSRETLIEQAYRNSIAYKLTQAQTLEEKRSLVVEHNPHHYIFGRKRRAWKPYHTYQENMEVQYIGEKA